MKRYEEAEEEDGDALMDEYMAKLEECAKANPDNAFGVMCVQSLQGMAEPAELREIIAALAPELQQKENIARILDTMTTGYRQQLDALFRDDAIDISADIDVLKMTMERDGLTGAQSPFAAAAETISRHFAR